MATVLKSFSSLIQKTLFLNPVVNVRPPVRHQWSDWRMLKDHRKRQVLKKYGAERLRVNSLRKNDILPQELKEIADQEIAALPRASSIVQLVPRCSLTSRPRGIVYRYRLSRIVWRHLADYNKLYGVQRARW